MGILDEEPEAQGGILAEVADWWNRGGIAGSMGMDPAARQIMNAQRNRDEMRASGASMLDQLLAGRDNPMLGMFGTENIGGKVGAALAAGKGSRIANALPKDKANFKYARHYDAINTQGKARVTEDIVQGERPAGMPRPQWKDMIENPYIVQGTGRYKTGQRFPTQEAADQFVKSRDLDQYQQMAIQEKGAADIIEDFLKDRGVKYTRDNAKTTESSYLRPEGMPEIRVSGHSKGIWFGGNSRSHSGHQLDIGMSNKAQVASLLRSIDDYLANAPKRGLLDDAPQPEQKGIFD